MKARALIGITIAMIMLASLAGMVPCARAAPGDDDPHPAILIFVESDYIVDTEKVSEYDRDLTFRIIAFDDGLKNYTLVVNNAVIDQGNFTHFKIVNYTHTSRLLTELNIYVNGNLTFTMRNVIIYNRASYGGGGADAPAAFWDMSYSDWKDKQFYQFAGAVAGGVYGVTLMGYVTAYWYRKKFGEETLASSF